MAARALRIVATGCLVACAIGSVVSCRDTRTGATGDAGAVDATQRAECHEELAAFCRLERCASYEETRATSARLAAAPRAPELGEDVRVQDGSCGGLRFVSRADMSYGWKQLFDGNGALTGAVRWGDSRSYCQATSFRATFGNVPDACL